MVSEVSSIQIIGTQRSGSNLLRLMLNQFDEITAPHPPHVLRTFLPILKHYGNLSDQENFLLLALDIADFVNANPVPWKRSIVDGAELASRARHQTLLSLYEMLYVIRAEHEHAGIWCCKSMFNEYYVKDIEEEGIKPFYIYIYRDGRDVAASFKKAIVGPKHIYHIAQLWKLDQEKAEQVLSYVGKERFFSIKYEDLIIEPQKVLKSLSSKLGLCYSPKLLDYYKSAESKLTAASGEMWKNVAKPIIKNNVGKFRLELTDNEIEIFENIAGKALLRLDYSLIKENNPASQKYPTEQIGLFNQSNTDLQQKARDLASVHDLQIRSNQEEILNKINTRFGLN